MNTINRANCRVLSADIMQALQAVAEKHNLTLDHKTGKFDPASFTLPVVFSVAEKQNELAEADFAAFAEFMGCNPDWFGQSFMDKKGTVLTVVGLNTRAPKNCIELKSADGKNYKCSPAYIRQFLS